MLYPSLYFLDADGFLPEGLRIVGAARSAVAVDAFVARVEAAVRERAGGTGWSDAVWARFRDRLGYVAADASKPETFEDLCAELKGTDEAIYYLSTSPDLYGAISAGLKRCGLSDRARVVVEKPLGRDLASCRAINDALADAFGEERVFRIDHYLGKETVQNLLALRFANAFFEPLWNQVSIEQVQITVAETVGLEGRHSYYDHYGALRDMVQNHVLQLLCLVAMEPPASLDPDSVRNEKVKVLRSLRPITGPELKTRTVRGQYARGISEGHAVPGYVEEAEDAASDTETFAALNVHVDNWRWANVPFYLRTGKRMAVRRTEIVIQFREVPHSIFPGNDLAANRLTIRLQPEEDISLLLMNKTPSLEQEGMQLKSVALSLSLADAFSKTRRRIAYERLLLAVLNNDPTLFVRRDEAEAAWAFIDGIEAGWARQGLDPLPYPSGSWGPSAAFALTERNGHSWYE
jgi:glucose-6-phosphate 1-dehydrogenase